MALPEPADWSDVVNVMTVLKGQGRLSPVQQFCEWVAEKDALDKLMRNI